MEVIKEIGNDKISKVYVCKINEGYAEFTESLYHSLKGEDKLVITISCLLGCPVKCLMCDAGQEYYGKLRKEDIFNQIDFIVDKRFPNKRIPLKKFKIQFTRMGEPAFNPAVLEVLEELPTRYYAHGLIPSISTIGPKNCTIFFRRLKEIKNMLYANGKFQMQFSIHTTDTKKRDQLIPTSKMSFQDIAAYGKEFYVWGDRKITLNFIVMHDYPIDPKIVQQYFDPEIFLIKLTPLNPTINAARNKLTTKLDPNNENSISWLVKEFKSLGFETIISIGELEENTIGSNCGQYVSSLKK